MPTVKSNYPEWDLYEAHLAEWQRKAPHRWVCVFGKEYEGFFETQSAAIERGVQKWPCRSFAVFQIGMTKLSVSLNDLQASA